MKKLLLSAIIAIFPFVSIFSDYELMTWKFRPQMGIWFGPVTPVPGSKLSDILDTYLGGGLFFRMNIPSDSLVTEIGFSYGHFTSQETARLDYFPMYANLSYKLPFDMPISLRTHLGGGAMYLYGRPEKKYNFEPFTLLGGELSFPAGKWVNIGAKFDYLFVIEDWVNKAKNIQIEERINGHFFQFGLMVNFYLSR